MRIFFFFPFISFTHSHSLLCCDINYIFYNFEELPLRIIPVNESMVWIDYQPFLDTFIEDHARYWNLTMGVNIPVNESIWIWNQVWMEDQPFLDTFIKDHARYWNHDDFPIETIGIGNVSYVQEEFMIHGAMATMATENITLYDGRIVSNLDGPMNVEDHVLQPLVKGSNILAKLNPCEEFENLWMIIVLKRIEGQKDRPGFGISFEKFADDHYYCQNGKITITEATKNYDLQIFNDMFTLFTGFLSELFNI